MQPWPVVLLFALRLLILPVPLFPERTRIPYGMTGWATEKLYALPTAPCSVPISVIENCFTVDGTLSVKLTLGQCHPPPNHSTRSEAMAQPLPRAARSGHRSNHGPYSNPLNMPNSAYQGRSVAFHGQASMFCQEINIRCPSASKHHLDTTLVELLRN